MALHGEIQGLEVTFATPHSLGNMLIERIEPSDQISYSLSRGMALVGVMVENPAKVL